MSCTPYSMTYACGTCMYTCILYIYLYNIHTYIHHTCHLSNNVKKMQFFHLNKQLMEQHGTTVYITIVPYSSTIPSISTVHTLAIGLDLSQQSCQEKFGHYTATCNVQRK